MKIQVLEKSIKYKAKIVFVIEYTDKIIIKEFIKFIKFLRKRFLEDFDISIFQINLFSKIDDVN